VFIRGISRGRVKNPLYVLKTNSVIILYDIQKKGHDEKISEKIRTPPPKKKHPGVYTIDCVVDATRVEKIEYLSWESVFRRQNVKLQIIYGPKNDENSVLLHCECILHQNLKNSAKI